MIAVDWNDPKEHQGVVTRRRKSAMLYEKMRVGSLGVALQEEAPNCQELL